MKHKLRNVSQQINDLEARRQSLRATLRKAGQTVGEQDGVLSEELTACRTFDKSLETISRERARAEAIDLVLKEIDAQLPVLKEERAGLLEPGPIQEKTRKAKRRRL